MLLKALHQVRALHACYIGRPVINFGGGHKLAALRHACNEQGLQVGAGGVDGSSVARWARAKNQDFCVLWCSHIVFVPVRLRGRK